MDLGTSHIKLSLYDLTNGQWIAGRYGLNSQVYKGSDVMTRIVAASESPRQAREMSQQVVEAIGEALWDMAIKEFPCSLYFVMSRNASCWRKRRIVKDSR